MWAILGTLCIIIVILLYYNYSTRSEPFVGSPEVYLVRPDDGLINVDTAYTVPQAVARAFNATIATLAQVQTAFASGVAGNTIYPMWDISGIVAYNGSEVQVLLPVRASMGSSSSSNIGSSSSSGPKPSGPTLLLTSIPPPTSAAPLTVPGVLLYGLKPPYERRTVGISGRNYSAEFYNYGRNVWSTTDVVQYKCKNITDLTSSTNKTYGSYANDIVDILEYPSTDNKISVQITGGANRNRTYPGCDPTCDVCEKTVSPYYDQRPVISKNDYEHWKDASLNLDIHDDVRVLNDRIPPTGKTDPSKLTSSLRLIHACRAAGGLPSLSVEEKGQFAGCTSWCCVPDNDIPILLPLAQDDPAADTVGKTCEPAEEAQCDAAPRPAPNDTDAYRLIKDGQRTRITAAVKRQYCKAKQSSIRTLAQEHKSEKLLKRLAQK